MKLLKLSPYHEPEQVASTHLTKDLNRAYIDAGFTIENFVPVPTRGVSDEIRNKYKKIKLEKLENGKIVIHRFSLFREGTNPVQRAVRYVLCNMIQYYKGIHAEGISAVIAGSTPPTQGVLCALTAKRLSKKNGKKVPFIYNLQDIFPDSLVNANMTSEGSLIWKIGRKIEDYTYRNSDFIIVISDDFKKNIMAKGVPEEKIVVVSNWVNTDSVYPVSREDNALFDRFGLDRSKFYVCYSGNIGHSQNLQLLIKAACQLEKELPDVHFVLFGEGAAKEELAQTVKEKNIENITLLPFQPYEDIAQVFSLGDADLIISKAGIGGSSVPSKTWSILASARPVIASFDKDSSLASLINETGCGITAEADSLEELVAAVKEFYSDREKCRETGRKGLAYIKENLSKEKCTAVYVDTINRAVNGGK